MSAPITGVSVLEVGNFLAAPFCTRQLADLGAEVIKIENPDSGDAVRATPPFVDGESTSFIGINRNKRSLALDLKSPQGKEVFSRLADRADVIVENLRPGAMSGLGFTYESLSETNPRLIYVAASGWGQDGPYAMQPGLDIIAQGMSGIMSITGEKHGAPVKVGVPICDLVCALYGALAAVSALYSREQTGRGQFIDVSLFEAGVSFAVWESARFFTTGEVPGPRGTAHQSSAPYQAIRASDGYFNIGAPTQSTWVTLCKSFGLEHLVDDPRFVDNADRLAEIDDLVPLLESVSETKPMAHWIDLLSRAGVPAGAIQTYDRVFNDEHLNLRNFFPMVPHTSLGLVQQVASPMRFSETPTRMDRAGPLLGEHSIEILEEAGIDSDTIDQLLANKVVAGK